MDEDKMVLIGKFLETIDCQNDDINALNINDEAMEFIKKYLYYRDKWIIAKNSMEEACEKNDIDEFIKLKEYTECMRAAAKEHGENAIPILYKNYYAIKGAEAKKSDKTGLVLVFLGILSIGFVCCFI